MGQEKVPALENFLHHYYQICPECETQFDFHYLPSEWELTLFRGTYKKCPTCSHMIFVSFSKNKVNIVVQEYIKILECTDPELIKS